MIGCCREPRQVQETKVGKVLGLFPEIALKVAALKLLQPAPLCPALGDLINTRTFLSGIGSILIKQFQNITPLHPPLN